MRNPTERFSNKVEHYIKYRPDYPPETIELFRAECGLEPASVIADVGSGTGILSEMFLRNGNTVYGVEPNREMREAGERLLAGYENFVSIEGAAEATNLKDQSVDFITAAQAFHWFDRTRARREFLRILKPGGWTVFLWNDRRTDSTPFLEAYEKLLLEYGTDYTIVNHTQVDASVIASFFAPGDFRSKVLENRKDMDFDGLRGRLLSSSYIPDEDHPRYLPMLERLEEIFRAHERNGQVAFEYDTRIYYGQLQPLE